MRPKIRRGPTARISSVSQSPRVFSATPLPQKIYVLYDDRHLEPLELLQLIYAHSTILRASGNRFVQHFELCDRIQTGHTLSHQYLNLP